jgi:hypothetical protein
MTIPIIVLKYICSDALKFKGFSLTNNWISEATEVRAFNRMFSDINFIIFHVNNAAERQTALY